MPVVASYLVIVCYNWGKMFWLRMSHPRKHGLNSLSGQGFRGGCPHSLGKPIEWKQLAIALTISSELKCPHSLGKPIEWKPGISTP